VEFWIQIKRLEIWNWDSKNWNRVDKSPFYEYNEHHHCTMQHLYMAKGSFIISQFGGTFMINISNMWGIKRAMLTSKGIKIDPWSSQWKAM